MTEPADLRAAQQPTTVTLRNGDVVDVFPSGTVQIYTANKRHGCEITLPRPTTDGGTVSIHNLG